MHKAEKDNTRERYFDLLKGLAMLMIFCSHYISWNKYEYLIIYDKLPFRALTGKMGAAFFAVILGFFAYNSALNINKSLLKLIFNRYVFFVSYFLAANILYSMVHVFPETANVNYTPMEIVKYSVLLNDTIFPTFWFVLPFFWGSIVSYVNGKFNIPLWIILAEIFCVFMIPNGVWISLCILGNVLFVLNEKERKLNVFLVMAIAIICVFSLPSEENKVLFFMYAVVASCIVYVVSNVSLLHNNLKCKLIEAVGIRSFDFLLVHVVVYVYVSFYAFQRMPMTNLWLIVVGMISIGVSFFLSMFLHNAIGYLVRRFCETSDYMIFILEKKGK